MIVKCEQCQTRFKIPDDKVTDRGVKVRCTKCGHTFRVTRDMAQPATGAFAAQSAPVAPPPPPAPARTPEVDPFAKFGSATDSGPLDPTRPGIFALGVEATRPADKRSTAFDFSSLEPPRPMTQPSMPAAAAPAPAPFDFSQLGAAVAPPPQAAPAQPSAFDFSALTAPPPPAPAPAAVAVPSSYAAPAAKSSAAFDFSALTAPPPPPPAPPAAARVANSPAAASTPAFDFSVLGPAPSEAPAAPSPNAFDALQAPVASPSAPWSNAAPPRASPPATSAPPPDDFFGAPMSSPPRPAAAPSTQQPRQLLDIPDDLSQDEVKSALFDLPAPTAHTAPTAATELVPAMMPAPSPPVASVASRPQVVPAEPPPRRRTALGVVLNVLVAAVLVAGVVVVGSAILNDGKVTRETLSLESLRSTFSPSTNFVPVEISNGLYETRGGRSVFYVRGDIVNRGDKATRLLVQADIVEGATVVRSAKSLAGAVPTAEELYQLSAADDLDKLNGRLSNRAVTVEPRATAPFLVAFTEYPPDLKAFRVRVVAQPADTAEH